MGSQNRYTVLVVDDTPDNIHVLGGVLSGQYVVRAARSGNQALKIASRTPRPDIILLDIMMPEMDGYEVCKRLKADPLTSNIPVIFVTAKDDIKDEEYGFTVGAVDYITKPISPLIVLARVKTHLQLFDQNRELNRLVEMRTSELNETRLHIIHQLGKAAEYKDNETGLHVVRMALFAKLIAEAYGGNEDWVNTLFNAAPMHDIGKIGIPDRILKKQGKLDAEEWEIIKQHPQIGASILGEHESPLLQMSRDIALTHHEKWDGSGYPYGLAGEEIPLEGRIVALADVFDAITSVRPYKKAWSIEEAIKHMNEQTGIHFDPKLMPLFHQVLPSILEIKKSYSDNGDS